MDGDLLPKKVLPPIPPKPPRLCGKIYSKFRGRSNPLPEPEPSSTKPRAPEVPLYDNIHSGGDVDGTSDTENPYEYVDVGNVQKPPNENGISVSSGGTPVIAPEDTDTKVQCPGKSSTEITEAEPVLESENPELESRSNIVVSVSDTDANVEIECGENSIPGNSADEQIETCDCTLNVNSISSADADSFSNTLIESESLPIRPDVEGCLTDDDNQEHLKNSERFICHEQKPGFELEPKQKPHANANAAVNPSGVKLIHRSVNGVTTIEIDPPQSQSQPRNPSVIHHVINLPPRRANSLKRRRKKTEDFSYHKSMRLSQIMMTEYKTNCTDRPTSRSSSNASSAVGELINKAHAQGSLESCKNNVEAVGRTVRKKVGSWYRRSVKTPVENLGLDGKFKVSQIPLPFGTRICSTPSSTRSNSQSNGNESTDETDDSCPILKGQNEFEDLRKLVKQGGDFCKDLAAVLQERSELEAQYAKGLSKLSGKLLKASKEATGSVAHAWQAVAVQIDTQAELHRLWSTALLDEVAKPLRNSTETQHKIRKSVEGLVEKTTRNLAEWRTAETKSKRQCFSSSKEFEKIQESSASLMSNANLHSTVNLSLVNGSNGTMTTNNSVLAEVRARSRILSVPPTDKDPIKLEAKRRKAEEAVRRADIEYYTFCVRSERARLEWEGAIRNGSTCLRTLEEEKLALLKELALKYFQHFNEFIPKLVRSAESLEEPIRLGSVDQDMHSVFDIRRHAGVEQLLPDFYAEDTSNLMKKERRQEALQKFLYLIKQDLDREKKGAVGIENLAKAIAEAPKVDNAHHDISDKVYYMKSMLMYLEGARCKIENALADIEGRQRTNTAITQYMRYQRDKQGLPQTILKVPTWARDDCLNCGESTGSSSPDWNERDRGAGDGTSSNRPDTDFDEFSSEESEHTEEVFDETEDAKATDLINAPSIGRCRVIYDYDSNMFDELTIRCGETINLHDKQEDGWWLGELNGVVGIFPATYVEMIAESVSDTSDKV